MQNVAAKFPYVDKLVELKVATTSFLHIRINKSSPSLYKTGGEEAMTPRIIYAICHQDRHGLCHTRIFEINQETMLCHTETMLCPFIVI